MRTAPLLAVLSFLLTLSLPSFGAQTSYIPEMQYLRLSADESLTLDQALADNRWQPLAERTPNFGYIQDPIWLRFDVTDPERINLLEISYPQLDSIDFYLLRNGELAQEVHTGDRYPFSERPVQHPHFLFPFTLDPASSYEIVMRVATEGAMQIPLRLWNNRSYFESASVESQLHAGYYGILITVICFNLFVFVALRESVYLLYVLSTLGYLLLVGSLNGMTYQVLWPGLPEIQNRAMLLTVPFAMIFTLLFSRSFLRLKEASPNLNHLVMFLIAINVATGIATFFVDYSTGSRLTVALAIPGCLLLTIVGPVLWWRGNPQAVFYTLAWGALTLGSAVTAANKYGLIPNNFVTAYGMQIGSALEAILLSLALAARIYHERQDKVLAQQAELTALEARRAAEL
ncbi:MAG: diguanylate cyclase, partial [Marinobacter sp. 34-60-7]